MFQFTDQVLDQFVREVEDIDIMYEYVLRFGTRKQLLRLIIHHSIPSPTNVLAHALQHDWQEIYQAIFDQYDAGVTRWHHMLRDEVNRVIYVAQLPFDLLLKCHTLGYINLIAAAQLPERNELFFRIYNIQMNFKWFEPHVPDLYVLLSYNVLGDNIQLQTLLFEKAKDDTRLRNVDFLNGFLSLILKEDDVDRFVTWMLYYPEQLPQDFIRKMWKFGAAKCMKLYLSTASQETMESQHLARLCGEKMKYCEKNERIVTMYEVMIDHRIPLLQFDQLEDVENIISIDATILHLLDREAHAYAVHKYPKLSLLITQYQAFKQEAKKVFGEFYIPSEVVEYVLMAYI